MPLVVASNGVVRDDTESFVSAAYDRAGLLVYDVLLYSTIVFSCAVSLMLLVKYSLLYPTRQMIVFSATASPSPNFIV